MRWVLIVLWLTSGTFLGTLRSGWFIILFLIVFLWLVWFARFFRNSRFIILFLIVLLWLVRFTRCFGSGWFIFLLRLVWIRGAIEKVDFDSFSLKLIHD